MRILLLVCLGLWPSVGYAHSGLLLNTVSNYLPFLLPLAAGAAAVCRSNWQRLWRR